VEGAWYLASWKRTLTSFSESPRHLLMMLEALMLKKVVLSCCCYLRRRGTTECEREAGQ